jgi:hypothetical protein
LVIQRRSFVESLEGADCRKARPKHHSRRQPLDRSYELWKETMSERAVVDNKQTESDRQLLMLYKISRSSAWMAFFTLVIAAGISACAYFFWQQMSTTQDVLDDLDDLSGKIQSSLDVANKQSITMTQAMQSIAEQIKSNTSTAKQLTLAAERLQDMKNTAALTKLDRPWVGIDQITSTSLRAGQPFVIKTYIRNSGRSPATDMRSTFSIAAPAASAAAAPPIEDCTNCVRMILLPNSMATEELRIGGDVLSPDKVKRVQTGADKIVVSGRIDYSDSANHPHTTTVCMLYEPAINRFGACPSGNHFE